MHAVGEIQEDNGEHGSEDVCVHHHSGSHVHACAVYRLDAEEDVEAEGHENHYYNEGLEKHSQTLGRGLHPHGSGLEDVLRLCLKEVDDVAAYDDRRSVP